MSAHYISAIDSPPERPFRSLRSPSAAAGGALIAGLVGVPLIKRQVRRLAWSLVAGWLAMAGWKRVTHKLPGWNRVKAAPPCGTFQSAHVQTTNIWQLMGFCAS